MHSTHIPQSPRTVVIIGGGLGGLFTGALLAKNGCCVTILEKNATSGGGLQTFRRFGEVFDTGMHVIAGLHEGCNVRRICDYLGITQGLSVKHVDAKCTDSIYVAQDDATYDIAGGKEGFVASLASYFPEERQNLQRYVEAMHRMAAELPLFNLRPYYDEVLTEHSEEFGMAADAFIAKYIGNAKLRALLSHINILYSGVSDMTPAYIHCILSVLYMSGPSRFVGGSSRLATLLEDIIKDGGGSIMLNEAVTEIACENRKIIHVKTSKGQTYHADYYVSDIHPAQLLRLFTESVFPKSFVDRIHAIPDTYSAFTLNIKLKAESFKYLNSTAYYYDDYDSSWRLSETSDSWPLGFIYMTPPEDGQGEYATKMIVTVPMMWDAVKEWEDTIPGNRPERYVQWKKCCEEKILQKLEKHHPNIRQCIEHTNTASPLTIRDFYGTRHGSMCGFSKDYKNPSLSLLSTTTKVKNLVLTGQNVSLHGFCGVPLTAIRTAEKILGKNTILNEI